VGRGLVLVGAVDGQDLGRPRVQEATARFGNVTVDHRPDERMDELDRTRRCEDVGRDQLIEGVCGLVNRELADGRRGRELGTVTQDGSHERHRGDARNMAIALVEASLDAPGDGGGCCAADRIGRDRGIRRERTQELLEQERIAAADVVAGSQDPRIRDVIEMTLDDDRDSLRAQRFGLDYVDVGFGDDRAQRLAVLIRFASS
jgi:hypothetical protein